MANRRDRAYSTCIDYINRMMRIVINSYYCPDVSDEDIEYVINLLHAHYDDLNRAFFAFQVGGDPVPTPQNGYSYSYRAPQDPYDQSLYSQSALREMTEVFKRGYNYHSAEKSYCNIGGDQYDQERRDESKTE